MAEPTELRTERLLLRPWSLDDAEDMLAYSQDEEMARYIPGVSQPFTRSDAEQFVAQRILKSWDTSPQFAIVLSSNVIGGIGLDIDVDNAIWDLAYGIAMAHWGKGLTTEAAQAVTDWGFKEYGLEKVLAIADLRNKGLWRVMEKLGLTREGVLRSVTQARDGSRSDKVYYGVLRSEWEAAHDLGTGPN